MGVYGRKSDTFCSGLGTLRQGVRGSLRLYALAGLFQRFVHFECLIWSNALCISFLSFTLWSEECKSIRSQRIELIPTWQKKATRFALRFIRNKQFCTLWQLITIGPPWKYNINHFLMGKGNIQPEWVQATWAPLSRPFQQPFPICVFFLPFTAWKPYKVHLSHNRVDSYHDTFVKVFLVSKNQVQKTNLRSQESGTVILIKK